MYEAGIVIFHASLLVYLASLWHFAMYAVRGWQRLASRASLLSICGLAIHAVSIVLISLGQGTPPWLNSLQNISFWCWVMMGISVVVSYRFRLKALGLFVLPLALALLFIAMTGQKSPSFYGHHVGRSFWVALHIGLVFVGYASFAFAAVIGLMYILQSRYLKKGGAGELSGKLPPLDTLDRLNYLAMLAGLAFLTAGLIIGFFWLAFLPKKPLGFDPKILGSLGIWGAYAVLFAMRATSLVRGKKVAWLSILGMAVIVLSFLFIPHMIPKELSTTRCPSPDRPRLALGGNATLLRGNLAGKRDAWK
jgi:ABC-type uncharacterized transport system permease subunit